MATHTLGPWSVGKTHDSHGPSVDIIDARGGILAGVEMERFAVGPMRFLVPAPGECEANARLIAAAPDILAAAQAVAAFAKEKPWTGLADGDKSLLADLRAAIAKAEGR